MFAFNLQDSTTELNDIDIVQWLLKKYGQTNH